MLSRRDFDIVSGAFHARGLTILPDGIQDSTDACEREAAVFFFEGPGLLGCESDSEIVVPI